MALRIRRRNSPDAYALEVVVSQTIGEGDLVVLGDDAMGPVSFPETAKRRSGLVLAGAAPVVGGSTGEVDATQAFSRIATGLRRSFGELRADLTRARRHSHAFFILMCACLTTGLLLILTALALLLSGFVQPGVMSTVGSTVFQAATAVLFKKDRELRRAIESYDAHLVSYHRFLAMADVAETISDPQTRDRAKYDIIRLLLTAHSLLKDGPDSTSDERMVSSP